MISGSFNIIPVTVGFAGQLCRFIWSSSGANYAIIPSVGTVPPDGERLVYVANSQTYTITFTDTVNTLTLSKMVTANSDPTVFLRQTVDNATSILVVRNVQEHSFNQKRPPSSGTPSYIISSYWILPLYLLSDEDFAVIAIPAV